VTRDEAERYARDWAAAWNRRDVDAVLALFVDDVAFTSPTAQAVVGHGTVRGKPALKGYWSSALARITTLHFTVDRVIWDPASRELAILYVADINGARKRVTENFVFAGDGRIASAEVLHGVTLP
jgi:ketosteroid isomerase-like protein